MGLFDGRMEQRDRIEHVARLLGLSPDHPDSWPLETIERALNRAERWAEQSLAEDVRSLLGSMMRGERVGQPLTDSPSK